MKRPPSPQWLSVVAKLADHVAAPWSLVPSNQTMTGTIVLHDKHGMAMADLLTTGRPTDTDRLIARSPEIVMTLLKEVNRLREIIGCTEHDDCIAAFREASQLGRACVKLRSEK